MAEQHVPSVGNHVRFSGGKNSGTVTTLVTANDSDRVVGFIVHYGWRGRKAKMVPINDVKWINPDNVVLTLTRRQFDALDEWNGPTDLKDVAPEATVQSTSGAEQHAHD